jgi:hypothetical protein
MLTTACGRKKTMREMLDRGKYLWYVRYCLTAQVFFFAQASTYERSYINESKNNIGV